MNYKATIIHQESPSTFCKANGVMYKLNQAVITSGDITGDIVTITTDTINKEGVSLPTIKKGDKVELTATTLLDKELGMKIFYEVHHEEGQ